MPRAESPDHNDRVVAAVRHRPVGFLSLTNLTPGTTYTSGRVPAARAADGMANTDIARGIRETGASSVIRDWATVGDSTAPRAALCRSVSTATLIARTISSPPRCTSSIARGGSPQVTNAAGSSRAARGVSARSSVR